LDTSGGSWAGATAIVGLTIFAAACGGGGVAATEGPCAPRHRGDGIRVKESHFTIGARVANGTAYDCATLDIRSFAKVVLPKAARVSSDAPPGVAVVRMAKEVGFSGHPPKPITPEVARRNMGVAFRAGEGGVVEIATFGEWDSHIEGGAAIRVHVSLPKDTAYDFSDLSARGHSPPENGPGYWYAAGAPDVGWTRIPSWTDEDSAREAR
jgi:hypothetical protein